MAWLESKVGLGEVDGLHALVGDGDGGDGGVGLAALLNDGHQGVELLVGQVGGGEAHLLGDGVDDVDVKAHGLAGLLVHVLEGGKAQLGDDGELAVLDEGHALLLVGLGVGGGVGAGGVGVAATGKHGAGGDGAKGGQELATVHVHLHGGSFPRDG